MLYRNIPPSMATIDLQLLVEEDQKQMLALIGEGATITDQQRTMLEQRSIDFAKKLSSAVSRLEQDCRCVMINKAAILGSEHMDYTHLIRERLKPWK